MTTRKVGRVVVSGEVLRARLGLPEGCTLHFEKEDLARNLFTFLSEGGSMPEVAEGAEPPELNHYQILESQGA